MPPESAKTRVTFLMLLCLSLASAVMTRAGYIQLLGNSRLEQMARRQFQSKVLIRPRRGAILDRNGEPLAVNVETHSLAANPAKIQNKKTLARLLTKATDLSYSKLLQRLSEKREFIWIKRHLTENEMNLLRKWKIIDSEGDLVSGLWLVKESQRAYPHGELAAHVLGDVNIDAEGLEGVELWMNERLRGKVASVSAIKDALGRPTFIDAVAVKHIQDGAPVALTLDASLQFAVEQELSHAVKKYNAKGGSVIVMNAITGEILAMSNQPSFNPNDRGQHASAEKRRNRVVTDGYEPGSTLKPVLIAAALNHGWKMSDRVFGERGLFKVQGKKISEAEAHEKFEWISLKEVIQYSSNIGAAKVALRLGSDRYISTLKDFGFGEKTEIGFPGETSGQIPLKKAWQPLTLANIGFGQGIMVTPIQMARAYAALINGGWLVQPVLLKSPSDVVKVEPPQRILSQKVSDSLLTALESVTEEKRSGFKARLHGYRVAGKTGTAQKVDPGHKGYARNKYVSSFIGFPLGVEQKLVIFASIDEPQGLYYAADTAAPLFREVLNAVASRFSLPAQLPRILAQAPAPVPTSAVDTLKVSQSAPIPASMQWHGANSSGVQTWKMPALRGLTAREAFRTLEGHRFKLEVHGFGVIKSQSPDEGKIIGEGETIRLSLAEP